MAGCIFALGWGALAVTAQTPKRALVPGHVPEVVANLPALGRLDGSTRLKLSISLPLHNQEALADFLDQLYDASSPAYHHYLAPEEFDARFGPTEEDYRALITWATASGFTVTARHPNRMILEVNAPVSDIERAFQVTLRTYQHPTEPRTFFAPDTEPSVEAGIPILCIGGLNNFARPHPKNLRRAPLRLSAEARPKAIGSGPNGTLAGFDFRAAYAPGVSLTGTGQKVGLVEFDGYYAGDITLYESLTGVPDVPQQIVLLDSFNGVPTTGVDSGNSEVALDIEMAIAMAPGLSNVVVYEAGPDGLPNDVLDAMSTNKSIKQFSCSWDFGSLTASERTNMDTYFIKFATQGQSFFDASGDSGAYTNAIAIPAPDDDQFITLVGGTTLAAAGPGGPWLSETVWNAEEGPGVAGSSGGVSTLYNIPTWQKGINMTAVGGSTSKRNGPDVAMVADNVFIVADNGEEEVTGGTSVAAPLWTAFTALANQRATNLGLAALGFINPALYHVGTNSGYTACFDDITVGNNTNSSSTYFFAEPGYDLCTGLGSPTGGSLIIALTQPDGFQITPGRGLVANGPAGGPFNVSTQTLLLTNVGMPAFNWSLGSNSAWLNVSSTHGTLTAGGGNTSVALTLNSAASLLPAGVYTNQLWFTNLTSGLAQLRQVTLQVGQELVLDGGFEANDFCYWTLSGNSSIYTNDYVDDGTATGYSPYDGNYFAALGEISNVAYLSQPVPTRPGQLYLVSFWLENPQGATPNQFLVRWNTNTTTTNVIFNQTNMGAFDWSIMQFTVKASTNTTTLQFGFRNDIDFFCLDDVSVMPLPAPAIQATTPGNGTFQLAWTALAGAQYQIQYLTNVTQTNWINLGGVITATSNPMTATEPAASGTQKFYRVVLLP